MLARLLLILLLAAFAVPGAAPAACHDAPMVSHHAMPMPASDTDRHVMPAHACIGCIPPSDWLGSRVAARVPTAAAAIRVPTAAMLVGASPSPDPRPPRLG